MCVYVYICIYMIHTYMHTCILHALTRAYHTYACTCTHVMHADIEEEEDEGEEETVTVQGMPIRLSEVTQEHLDQMTAEEYEVCLYACLCLYVCMYVYSCACIWCTLIY